jgi:hypothetical protein
MPRTALFPSIETELNSYFQTVAPYLLANTVRLVISAGNVIKITDNFAAWNLNFPPSQNPDTRTVTITDVKNIALLNMESICKDIYNDIPESALTSQDRNTLNLPLHHTTHVRVLAATVAPAITLTKSLHLEHMLRFQNPATPGSIAMPDGQQILLLYYIGAPGLTDANINFNNVLTVTRANNTIGFTDAQVGQTCYYRSCYVNTHQERGPLSATLSVIVG